MASNDSETLSEKPETPFHDLDHYLAIPKVSGLALSPDGGRLVTTVATLNAKGTEYGTALWELDPEGQKQARRITRSAKGEAGAVFAAGGDLYFSSARPDPETPEADPVNALWMLPADGGEARVVLTRAGGVSGLLAAKDTGALFVNASVLAGSTDEDGDEERRKARKDNKVAAILHSGYPVRYWDADLGPAQPRLFAVEPGEEQEPGKPATVDAAAPFKLRNLTPDAGSGLRDAEAVVSPDGKTIYSSFNKPLARANSRCRSCRDRRRHRHPQGPAGHRGNELLPRAGQPRQQDARRAQRERHHAGGGPAGQTAPARRDRRCARGTKPP